MSNLEATLYWIERNKTQLAMTYFLLLTIEEKSIVMKFEKSKSINSYIESIPQRAFR